MRDDSTHAAERIIFTGGRDFTDERAVDLLVDALPDHVTVVVGDARGADALVRAAAERRGLKLQVYGANWKVHGKKAGPLRNDEMVNDGAYLCVAFRGGKGTADCVRRAKAAGIPVKLAIWSDEPCLTLAAHGTAQEGSDAAA